MSNLCMWLVTLNVQWGAMGPNSGHSITLSISKPTKKLIVLKHLMAEGRVKLIPGPDLASVKN